MQKNIEKQLEQFVRGQIAGIHRIQITNGTMYLVLDKPSDCDFVHKEIRTFYKENINPDGGVNMYAVGDEFAFDFVPADAEAPVFEDEVVDLEKLTKAKIRDEADKLGFDVNTNQTKALMIDSFEEQTNQFIADLQDSGEFVSATETGDDDDDDRRDGGYF